MRRRQSLPDVVANAPQLLYGLEVYYEAFTELSTCRSIGMAMGPIPWSAINEYAARHGYVDQGFDYLVLMVRALDDTFLAYDRSEADRKRVEREGDGSGRHGRVRETD